MYRNASWLCAAVAFSIPILASADVVTSGLPRASGLPPVAGYPTPPAKTAGAPTGNATAATASATSGAGEKFVVPAIKLSPAAMERIHAHKMWEQAIATPPQGKESRQTADLAKQALAASQRVDVTPPPIGDADGAITSIGGRPVLVCSPLHTCVIALPVGTQPVTTVGVSPAQWKVQQSMVGKQPEIFLSPVFAGLHQNLVIAAATSKGDAINYQVRLVSDKNRYVPILRVALPESSSRTWSRSQLDRIALPEAPAERRYLNKRSRVLPLPLVPIAAIHTNWTIHCGGGGWFGTSDCQAIRPLRVYDDGVDTVIEMPAGLATHGGFPIVQAFNQTGKEIGINTQIRGHLIVIDSVPHKIHLRLGREVVNIERGNS